LIDKRGNRKNMHKSKNILGVLSRMTISVTLTIIGLFVGVIVGLLTFYLSMYVEAKRGTVILESYINQDVDVAAEQLKAKGFHVTIIGDKGRVIKMNPEPNTRVKLGREVKLFTENVKNISIILPDFKYSWYKSVQKILQEINVSTTIKTVSASEFPGTVISTAPTSKSVVRSWDNVTLFISSGNASGNSNISSDTLPESGTLQTQPSSVTEPSGPIEIVPPSVDLQSKQLQNEPTDGSNTQIENSTSTPETQNSTAVEGGQF
jgi:serine/threonine-protein kinase